MTSPNRQISLSTSTSPTGVSGDSPTGVAGGPSALLASFLDTAVPAQPVHQGLPEYPALRPITALDDLPEMDDGELFKDRFLCAGGACLVAACTGIGKSTLICGLTLHAAAGRPYLGLRPARPLRSWIIGAENDDHDLRDFFRGAEFQLRRDVGDDVADMARGNVYFAMVNTLSGQDLTDWLHGVLERTPPELRPDLLALDPAFAFIGGDALQQAVASAFLRGLLNPLLTQYRLGLILVHHANKPRKDQVGPSTCSDFAYLGAGSAEFANWARAVLALLPTSVEGMYELRAGKRGGRLSWTGPNGGRTCRRYIAQSSEPGEPFYWREATPEEIASLPVDRHGVGGRPASDIEALARGAGTLCKKKTGLQEFKKHLQSELCVGRPTAKDVIDRLVKDKVIRKFKVGTAWYLEPVRAS
jgi:hypothetical protein